LSGIDPQWQADNPAQAAAGGAHREIRIVVMLSTT
jgi:hypothetical protein